MSSRAKEQSWSLVFRDPTSEQEYLESQKENLRWTVLVGHVVILVLDVAIAIDTALAGRDRLDAIGVFDVAASVSIFCWAVIVIVTLMIRKLNISFTTVEAMCIWGTVFCMGATAACSTYRLPKMFNQNPKDYWNQSCFTDTYTLLTLDLYITATHLFVPLRSSRSWMIPVSATLFYVASCILYGSPEEDSAVLIVELGTLGLFAWVGRRRSEVESRLAFARQKGLSSIAEEKHKSMVQERVLRFDAERALDMATGMQDVGIPAVIGKSSSSDTGVKHKDVSDLSCATSWEYHSSVQGNVDETNPIIFLPSSAELLRQNAEDAGKLLVVQAAMVSVGQKICALDKSTGDVALAEVIGVSHELNRSPVWSELTITHGEATDELEGVVIVSTVVCVKSKRRFMWRAPAALNLGEDALLGIVLRGHNGSIADFGPGDKIRPVTFDIVGKRASSVSEMVAIQLAEPSKYAPFLGVSVPEGIARPFVAIGSFARQEVQFSAESDQL